MTSTDPIPHLLAETTIAGLFDERFRYEIPPYQRAYSWGGKNLDRFIKDLEDQPLGKPYYLGHFLFELPDSAAASVPCRFQVIDGQQRLTTIIIFFSCAIQELKRRESSGSVDQGSDSTENDALRTRYLSNSRGSRLETVDYDRTFFNNLITRGVEESINQDAPKSQKLIRAARDYFAERFSDKNCPVEQLSSWCRMIETAMVTTFVLRGADAKIRATQIFAFQNDRGITPTMIELLKAFLMHGVYLHGTDGADSDAIRDIQGDFAEIHRLHEGIHSLDEDQILSHHCVAFLESWEPALENIEKTLKAKKPDERVPWIQIFSSELRQTFRLVKEIQDAARTDFALADVLLLDAHNSWPLLLKLHRRHSGEKQSSPFRRALRLMEIILFKKDFSRADFRSHGFHECAKKYSGDLSALIATLTHWSQSGFKGYWRFNQVFRDSLNRPHQYFQTTRYLLWKYENWEAEKHSNPPLLPLQFLNLYGDHRWDETIEHIMPQNPRGMELDQEFRDKHLHSLGNLVMMNRSKNSVASDAPPREKVVDFLRSGLITHKLVVERINESKAQAGWGVHEIEGRQDEIIKFALEYWEAV